MNTETNPGTASAVALVEKLNDAWNAHDLDAALSLLSDDCVFEATSPAPDGTRHVGPGAIRDAWAPIFGERHTRFTIEATLASGDHVVQQWTYNWGGGHVRGIDVIHVAHGNVTAKRSYVKG